MSPKGPNEVEVLLILIPLFLIFPVIFVVLFAASVQAKRREAEESKAYLPKQGKSNIFRFGRSAVESPPTRGAIET